MICPFLSSKVSADANGEANSLENRGEFRIFGSFLSVMGQGTVQFIKEHATSSSERMD